MFENFDITLSEFSNMIKLVKHSQYRDNDFVNRSACQQRAEGIKVKEVCNKKLLNKKKIILCLPFCELKKKCSSTI